MVTITLQDDGKILIGGSFSTVNGIPRNNIARLNADGSLDTTFDPGSGTNSMVREILLLPDNDLIIGGDFTQVNGVQQSYVARLNSDGSVDTSFQISFGGLSDILSLLLQPDNKLLIGGVFTQVNSVYRNGIARLNLDGSVDTSFDPGQGITNGSLLTMGLQSDGKILIGGFFVQVDGVTCNRIARLNSDGSLDTSFDIVTGFDAGVKRILIQPDQNVLVAGWFTKFDDINRNRVARIMLEKYVYLYAETNDINEGAEINFAGYLANSNPDAYTWDFGDGTQVTNTLSLTHSYLDNPEGSINGVGTYTVSLTITDTNGWIGNNQIPITVRNVAPEVEAGSDRTIDVGRTITYTAIITDPGILDTHSIIWIFGDGLVVTDTLVVSHTWTVAGIYPVTITVIDDDWASGSDSLVTTVLTYLYLPFTLKQ